MLKKRQNYTSGAAHLVVELGELLGAGIAAVILALVIEDMDGFIFEELGDLRILVDDVSEIGFLEVGITDFVSDAHVNHDQRKDSKHLER